MSPYYNLVIPCMVDFPYKLHMQLDYNIYTFIFPIWTGNIIKVKIPLGSCKLYAKRDIS